MSTETIITVIILGLFLMVCLGFAFQTIERNRQEKKRMEAVLTKRLGSLHYLLENFPDNFLGSDLKILVCKSLHEVYDELSGIVPENKEYELVRTELTQKIQELQRNHKGLQYQPMENVAQIKEVKGLLSMLNNFIGKLKNQKKISDAQAVQYGQQLRQLMTQTSIDTYAIAARQAENADKIRLAIHYYESAIDKLAKEGMESIYHKPVLQYQEKILALQKIAEERNLIASPVKTDEADADADQWDTFMEDDPWKKKNVYD